MSVTVCGRCGGLVEPRSTRCDRCGRLLPGLLGLRPVLSRIFPPDPRTTTTSLVLLLVAVFVFTLLVSQSNARERSFAALLGPDPHTLARFGMLIPSAVADGEWWRLLGSCLLHGGALHILFNGVALAQLGRQVQLVYGPARMLILFVLAGIGGSLASILWLPDTPTVGASGSIFGLISAVIVFGIKLRGPQGELARRLGIQWLVYGLAFGFLVPGINNVAHLGGAAAGFAVAWSYRLKGVLRESDGAKLLGVAAWLTILGTLGWAIAYGFGLVA